MNADPTTMPTKKKKRKISFKNLTIPKRPKGEKKKKSTIRLMVGFVVTLSNKLIKKSTLFSHYPISLMRNSWINTTEKIPN